jgi:hypothetical protein
MAKPLGRAHTVNAEAALVIYVAACTVLVLIILYAAFAQTAGGVLAGEIYVRPAAATR